MRWSELSSEDKQKRIAWSVATSCAIETRQDPVDIYNRLMDEYQSMSKSNETQISGKP
jgi:transcription elongation factor Elf1